MGTVSIELVPRSEESLERELKLVKKYFPSIDTINIPDLLNFDLRSWEGGRLARKYVTNVIPHLRAIDFDLESGNPCDRIFCGGGFDKLLVITGGPGVGKTTLLRILGTVLRPTSGVVEYEPLGRDLDRVEVFAQHPLAR